MSTFTQVPKFAVIQFLEKYNLPLSPNDDTLYNMAYELGKYLTEVTGNTGNPEIQDWFIASGLPSSTVYDQTAIESLSDENLKLFAEALKIPGLDRHRLLKILKYKNLIASGVTISPTIKQSHTPRKDWPSGSILVYGQHGGRSTNITFLRVIKMVGKKKLQVEILDETKETLYSDPGASKTKVSPILDKVLRSETLTWYQNKSYVGYAFSRNDFSGSLRYVTIEPYDPNTSYYDEWISD